MLTRHLNHARLVTIKIVAADQMMGEIPMRSILLFALKLVAMPISWMGMLVSGGGMLTFFVGLFLAFFKPLSLAAVVCSGGLIAAAFGGLVYGFASTLVDNIEDFY